MNHSNTKLEVDLPTNKQLFISTGVSILVAAVLLITVVLPAEYGIDPSGVGERLGLKEMGTIKAQLESEVELADQKLLPKNIKRNTVNSIALSNSIKITLKQGQAAEVKVSMNKGQTTSYTWSVDKGHLNYDTHGDNPSTNYHNYNKGKAVKQSKGMITAAFTGQHGWFWRNRSEQAVTVTLNINGTYTEFKRVL